MDTLVTGLLRTTAILSVTAIAAWPLMKIARLSSPWSRRVVCCLILLQGWVFLRPALDIPVSGSAVKHAAAIADGASSLSPEGEAAATNRPEEPFSIATSPGCLRTLHG